MQCKLSQQCRQWRHSFFVLSKIFNFMVETGKGVAVTHVAGSQPRTQRITKFHTIDIFFKRFSGPRAIEFSSCPEPFLSFWFWTCTIFIQTDSIVPTAVWKELQNKYLNTLWKLVASITPCKHNLFSIFCIGSDFGYVSCDFHFVEGSCNKKRIRSS